MAGLRSGSSPPFRILLALQRQHLRRKRINIGAGLHQGNGLWIRNDRVGRVAGGLHFLRERRSAGSKGRAGHVSNRTGLFTAAALLLAGLWSLRRLAQRP